MVDIHCHILPAIDDGVQTMEEAIELIRMEVSGGTKAFIATSHLIEQDDYDRLDSIAGRVEALRAALHEAGVEAEIYPGAEVYPSSRVVGALKSGRPMTLADKGKHMLVDLPMGALPQDFESLLYEIKVRGVTPIIAHPERNAMFQTNPDLLGEYLEKGAACQVNASSLAGKYGPRAAEVVRLYLRRRWPHFLSSDAHRPGRRPILSTASEAIADLGGDYVKLLTETSGRCVIEGRPLPERPEAPPEPKKGLLGRLFGR